VGTFEGDAVGVFVVITLNDGATTGINGKKAALILLKNIGTVRSGKFGFNIHKNATNDAAIPTKIFAYADKQPI